MMHGENPFAPTTRPVKSYFDDVKRAPEEIPMIRWRLIPTLLLTIAGSFMFSCGLFAAGLMAYFRFIEERDRGGSGLLAVFVFYLGTGIFVLLTARAVWRQHYWIALVLFIISIAFPVGLLYQWN